MNQFQGVVGFLISIAVCVVVCMPIFYMHRQEKRLERVAKAVESLAAAKAAESKQASVRTVAKSTTIRPKEPEPYNPYDDEPKLYRPSSQ